MEKTLMVAAIKSLTIGGGVIAMSIAGVVDAGGQLTISSIAIGFTGLALVWFGSTMLKVRDDVMIIKGIVMDAESGLVHRVNELEGEVDKIKFGRRKGDTGESSSRSD